jgi:hypothetical protein
MSLTSPVLRALLTAAKLHRLMRVSVGLCLLLGAHLALQASPPYSIARIWDEEILSAIRIDLPNPPVHARNLFHLSVAMYDTWAAYDPVAVGYLYHDKHMASDVAAARREAISYAAYRLLTERYVFSKNAPTTLAELASRMASLGYDTNNVSLDTSTPAGVGNSVAALVSAYFLNDGALETRGYQDLPASQGGYVPINPPLLTQASGTLAIDVNRWQPLAFTNAVSQNNIPADLTQKFLGAQWLGVRPFALVRDDPTMPWFDPGPPPRMGTPTESQFRSNNVSVILASSQLTTDDGVTLDISPGAFGNNTLGYNDGTGHPINPVTGAPYAPNVVKRGDFARVLAEFWADGPNSETPPGHWNVIANGLADNPAFVKRIGGTGPVVDDLEWDVKVYFVVNAAVHDAACAAWSLKRYYDGWRPIEAIRYMGERGQASLTSDPTYSAKGLPLVPGLIEIVTSDTAQPGGRHAGLAVGSIAVYTWPGGPPDPTAEASGVHWIEAADWLPYQKKTFVTPAFPGYISGHSTFSRAAAEVLAGITGSDFFPGGIGTYTIRAGSLAFEEGPTQDIQLQWGTYFDASDQAGISRIWGGIHVPVDDFTGRRLGSQCGKADWALARQYFDGSILQAPMSFTIQRLDFGECQIRCETLRGFYYLLQSTTNLSQPFQDDPQDVTQAVDSSLFRTDLLTGPMHYYRVLRSLR